jgi:hypothetical protein
VIDGRPLCLHAVLHLENGGSFAVVYIADINDLRVSSVVTFIDCCLPDPACETVVVQTGIGHGEDVIIRVEQRLVGEPSATLKIVVSVCRWMDVEPAAVPSSSAFCIAAWRSNGTSNPRLIHSVRVVIAQRVE